jgi:hypothetical protein
MTPTPDQIRVRFFEAQEWTDIRPIDPKASPMLSEGTLCGWPPSEEGEGYRLQIPEITHDEIIKALKKLTKAESMRFEGEVCIALEIGMDIAKHTRTIYVGDLAKAFCLPVDTLAECVLKAKGIDYDKAGN